MNEDVGATPRQGRSQRGIHHSTMDTGNACLRVALDRDTTCNDVEAQSVS